MIGIYATYVTKGVPFVTNKCPSKVEVKSSNVYNGLALPGCVS